MPSISSTQRLTSAYAQTVKMDRGALVKILKALPEVERNAIVAEASRETDAQKAKMQEAAEALKDFIHGVSHDAV